MKAAAIAKWQDDNAHVPGDVKRALKIDCRVSFLDAAVHDRRVRRDFRTGAAIVHPLIATTAR